MPRTILRDTLTNLPADYYRRAERFGFGLGGSCPGGAVAMVTTGGLGALLCLAGPVVGLWLRGVAERASHQPMLPLLPRLGSVPG